jgi:hypothetical protein
MWRDSCSQFVTHLLLPTLLSTLPICVNRVASLNKSHYELSPEVEYQEKQAGEVPSTHMDVIAPPKDIASYKTFISAAIPKNRERCSRAHVLGVELCRCSVGLESRDVLLRLSSMSRWPLKVANMHPGNHYFVGYKRGALM